MGEDGREGEGSVVESKKILKIDPESHPASLGMFHPALVQRNQRPWPRHALY